MSDGALLILIFAAWLVYSKASLNSLSTGLSGAAQYASNAFGLSGNGVAVDRSGQDVGSYGDAGTLARTIYGEARGQSAAAQQGVASVVLNRLKGGFPGGSVAGICLAPKQFSCWLVNDPNYPKITTQLDTQSPTYLQCLSIATRAVAGSLPDDTDGAVFYHDTSISAAPADWGAVVQTVQLDQLVFYRKA